MASPNCVVASAQGIWMVVKEKIVWIQLMCTGLNPMIWEPPQIWWFRLNIDVAVDVHSGKVSYKAIIRNHKGLVYVGWR